MVLVVTGCGVSYYQHQPRHTAVHTHPANSEQELHCNSILTPLNDALSVPRPSRMVFIIHSHTTRTTRRSEPNHQITALTILPKRNVYAPKPPELPNAPDVVNVTRVTCVPTPPQPPVNTIVPCYSDVPQSPHVPNVHHAHKHTGVPIALSVA